MIGGPEHRLKIAKDFGVDITINIDEVKKAEDRIDEILNLTDGVGADMVVAGLVLMTGREEQDARNVEHFAQLAEESYELGIPLIGEVFPSGALREDPPAFHDYIVKACRIACELGADAIKTFYTGERFAEVTAGCPIPVLALGAEKLAHEIDALALAHKAVRAGAAGVVFGRNVVQTRDPALFLRGLKDVVRGRATPAEAAARYDLT